MLTPLSELDDIFSEINKKEYKGRMEIKNLKILNQNLILLNLKIID